ncbi:MAG: HNH endonuclease [Candidatus Brocadiales bacterium]|nr:HNH endonuclease [Candidatus Bathyanammoxibius sp.]
MGLRKPKAQKKKAAKFKMKPARKLARSNHKAFYRSPAWKKVRYEVLAASDKRCALCGYAAADGARLNVDHIKPLRKYPELALKKSNLQVLCGSCNQGKGAWDETDWRGPNEEELWRESMGQDYLRLVNKDE